MDMVTIEMPQAEARVKFLEYKRAVQARHDAEMEQIMRGYKALANGHQVIDLAATVRAGGVMEVVSPRRRTDVLVAPRLAVMRADAHWCKVATDEDGRVVFYGGEASWGPKTGERRYVVRLPQGTLPEEPSYNRRPSYTLRAMVPPVPPGLQPADKIGNYHILWEAEWEHIAPKDPALLKHIGGDLYAVVAVWDLTLLERTVLAGRFR